MLKNARFWCIFWFFNFTMFFPHIAQVSTNTFSSNMTATFWFYSGTLGKIFIIWWKFLTLWICGNSPQGDPCILFEKQWTDVLIGEFFGEIFAKDIYCCFWEEKGYFTPKTTLSVKKICFLLNPYQKKLLTWGKSRNMTIALTSLFFSKTISPLSKTVTVLIGIENSPWGRGSFMYMLPSLLMKSFSNKGNVIDILRKEDP